MAVVKTVKMPTKKTTRILSDKDFLKHGFEKESNLKECIFYEKKIGNYDFEISYFKDNTRDSIRMNLRIWGDRKDNNSTFYMRIMDSTLILKKTDLVFLLKRIPVLVSTQKKCLKQK